jgi:hypothetical protein
MYQELKAKTMQFDPFGDSRNWCFCMYLLEMKLYSFLLSIGKLIALKTTPAIQISLWNIEKVNEE